MRVSVLLLVPCFFALTFAYNHEKENQGHENQQDAKKDISLLHKVRTQVNGTIQTLYKKLQATNAYKKFSEAQDKPLGEGGSCIVINFCGR